MFQIVYAIFNNECVGMAHCTKNGDLYLTVHGSGQMTGKTDPVGVYKVLENNHVVIIRNNEKYDVTGKKITR